MAFAFFLALVWSDFTGDYPRIAASGTPCKVEHFIWRNMKGLNLMNVEGVISASTAVDVIHIQFYDANGKFLGTSMAVIQPGGSFVDTLPWQNPTSELKIKYQCQRLGS